MFSQINSNEHVIAIDGLLLAPLFLDILDEAKSHFDARAPYAEQQGQILAEADDKRTLAALISACRTATPSVTGGDQTSPEIDANMGTDVNILKAAIYGAAEQLDNFSVPANDRYCWIPPSAFYLLLQDGEFIDRDFNDPNGSRSTATMRSAADFMIVKTNNLPRDDWSAETQLSTRLQDDYRTDNLGVCGHASASGVVTLIGLQFEQEYTMERQGTMLIAKYAKGYDYLRPEAAVSLDLAGSFGGSWVFPGAPLFGLRCPMSETVPETELDAVNAMLHDIGERPVSTLENQSRLDVLRAINSLEKATRATCATGWWFNTENVIITLGADNKYTLTDDIVHAEVLEGGPVATDDQYDVELTQRGSVLYDRANATDEFPDNSEDVVLRCTRLLAFADMPATAREYVYCVASIRFQSRTLGSAAVDADLREQASIALTSLREEDLDHENLNQTTTPHFFNLMYNR